MMRSQFWPNVTFKAVNEYELEGDINRALGALFFSIEQPNLSYQLNLHYFDTNIILNDLSLLNASTSYPFNQPSGGYRLVAYTKLDEVLYDVNFLFPITRLLTPSPEWFDTNGNQVGFPDGDTTQTDIDVNFLIEVPYFPTGNKIKIFDGNGTNKLTIDISQHAAKIDYIIGYGGREVQSGGYKATYSLIQQPVARNLTSANYVCSLGFSTD